MGLVSGWPLEAKMTFTKADFPREIERKFLLKRLPDGSNVVMAVE